MKPNIATTIKNTSFSQNYEKSSYQSNCCIFLITVFSVACCGSPSLKHHNPQHHKGRQTTPSNKHALLGSCLMKKPCKQPCPGPVENIWEGCDSSNGENFPNNFRLKLKKSCCIKSGFLLILFPQYSTTYIGPFHVLLLTYHFVYQFYSRIMIVLVQS